MRNKKQCGFIKECSEVSPPAAEDLEGL